MAVTITAGFLQIWRLTKDGTDIQVLLNKRNGIDRPKFLHSDKEGKRLVVINKAGDEIRNYNVFKVFDNFFLLLYL